MNNLQKTENQFTHKIFGNLTTIINNNGDVYFVAKEVATILDQETKNILRRIDEEDVLSLTYEEATAHFPSFDIHSSGLRILTESGLYQAILMSNKPEAKQFKKWVTSEVLPTIRKTGSYTKTPQTYIEALKALIIAEEEKERLALQVDNMQQVMDSHTDWVSILKVSQFNNVSEKIFSWRVLKNKSIELGYLVKKVQSVRFDYQNIYHVNVWRAAYPRFNYNFNEDTSNKLKSL